METAEKQKDVSRESPGAVRILSCLLNAMLKGLYAAIGLQVLYSLSYLYMKSPASAWEYPLIGLDRSWALVVVYAGAVLNKMAVLWLAIACLVVWQWKKGLQRALPND